MRLRQYNTKESVKERLKEKFLNNEEVNPEALKKNSENALYNAMRNKELFSSIESAYNEAGIPLNKAFKKRQLKKEGWEEKDCVEYWWKLRKNENEEVHHNYLQEVHPAFFTGMRVCMEVKYNVKHKQYKFFIEEVIGLPYDSIKKRNANGENLKSKGIIETKYDLDSFLVFLINKLKFVDFKILQQDNRIINKIHEFYGSYNNWLVKNGYYEKKIRWVTSIKHIELGNLFEEIVHDVLKELGWSFQKNSTYHHVQGKLKPDFSLIDGTWVDSKLSVDSIKTFIKGTKIDHYLSACKILYLIYLIGEVDFNLPKGVCAISIHELIDNLNLESKHHFKGKLELLTCLHEDLLRKENLNKQEINIMDLYAEFQQKKMFLTVMNSMEEKL